MYHTLLLFIICVVVVVAHLHGQRVGRRRLEQRLAPTLGDLEAGLAEWRRGMTEAEYEEHVRRPARERVFGPDEP